MRLREVIEARASRKFFPTISFDSRFIRETAAALMNVCACCNAGSRLSISPSRTRSSLLGGWPHLLTINHLNLNYSTLCWQSHRSVYCPAHNLLTYRNSDIRVGHHAAVH